MKINWNLEKINDDLPDFESYKVSIELNSIIRNQLELKDISCFIDDKSLEIHELSKELPCNILDNESRSNISFKVKLAKSFFIDNKLKFLISLQIRGEINEYEISYEIHVDKYNNTIKTKKVKSNLLNIWLNRVLILSAIFTLNYYFNKLSSAGVELPQFIAPIITFLVGATYTLKHIKKIVIDKKNFDAFINYLTHPELYYSKRSLQVLGSYITLGVSITFFALICLGGNALTPIKIPPSENFIYLLKGQKIENNYVSKHSIDDIKIYSTSEITNLSVQIGKFEVEPFYSDDIVIVYTTFKYNGTEFTYEDLQKNILDSNLEYIIDYINNPTNDSRIKYDRTHNEFKVVKSIKTKSSLSDLKNFSDSILLKNWNELDFTQIDLFEISSVRNSNYQLKLQTFLESNRQYITLESIKKYYSEKFNEVLLKKSRTNDHRNSIYFEFKIIYSFLENFIINEDGHLSNEFLDTLGNDFIIFIDTINGGKIKYLDDKSIRMYFNFLLSIETLSSNDSYFHKYILEKIDGSSSEFYLMYIVELASTDINLCDDRKAFFLKDNVKLGLRYKEKIINKLIKNGTLYNEAYMNYINNFII